MLTRVFPPTGETSGHGHTAPNQARTPPRGQSRQGADRQADTRLQAEHHSPPRGRISRDLRTPRQGAEHPGIRPVFWLAFHLGDRPSRTDNIQWHGDRVVRPTAAGAAPAWLQQQRHRLPVSPRSERNTGHLNPGRHDPAGRKTRQTIKNQHVVRASQHPPHGVRSCILHRNAKYKT